MSVPIVVDVESDGPIPVDYSMVCFGAVSLECLNVSFHGKTAPISDKWNADALAISGYTRQQHLLFPAPETTMLNFEEWLHSLGSHDNKFQFISDNPAFDFQWINYYFHHFLGRNPFGFSARRIGDCYAGAVKDWKKANDWKQFRVTTHDHNPVNDARGNAEALRHFAHAHCIKGI